MPLKPEQSSSKDRTENVAYKAFVKLPQSTVKTEAQEIQGPLWSGFALCLPWSLRNL